MNTDKSSTHGHRLGTKPTTNTGVHSHGLTEAEARIAALEAQMANVILSITKLEANQPPPVPPSPEPPPIPGTQRTVWPGTGKTAFLALVADVTVGVIEMAAGTYAAWSCIINVTRPADKPLLIRPAAGAAVVFDGGGGGAPAFYVGWNSLASNITFDTAGTGGTFTLNNYTLGLAGLVMFKYATDVAVNGFRVRNCTGNVSQQTSHCLYMDSNGSQRSERITADNWDVVGPVNRWLSGLHIYHTPNVAGFTASGWTVSSLHRAAYVWSDATGIDIDGWTIDDCNATIDAQETAAGTVKNCTATDSGVTVPGSGYWTDASLVDGGGNSW